MIEHTVHMPDGSALRLVSDGHSVYPPRILTYEEALWVNEELAFMGVPERLNSVWNKLNGS